MTGKHVWTRTYLKNTFRIGDRESDGAGFSFQYNNSVKKYKKNSWLLETFWYTISSISC